MERIIIDTDPGIDDMFAIMLALQSEEIVIEGITTVEGNGRLEDVTNNAMKILTMMGRTDIKVYKGCKLSHGHGFDIVEEIHGRDAMGDVVSCDMIDMSYEDEYAVDYILRTIKENPGEITLATLGPLINIAEAIKKEPETMKLVKRIVMMGGAIEGGNVNAYAEANFFNDAEAAKAIVASHIPEKVMIGLDGTHKMQISSDVREIFNTIDSELAHTIYKITQTYVDFYWKQLEVRGFIPHDVLVIMYLIDPDIAMIKNCYIAIETEGIRRGQSVVSFNNVTYNAKVCTDAHSEQAIRLLFSRLFPKQQQDVELMLDRIYTRNYNM